MEAQLKKNILCLKCFFNTIITLIINARFYDFIPSLEISKIIPVLHDYMDEFLSLFYNCFFKSNSDKYPGDFLRKWYIDDRLKNAYNDLKSCCFSTFNILFYVIFNQILEKTNSKKRNFIKTDESKKSYLNILIQP